MTRQFKSAWVLLITTATLTFALTGFTLYNFEDLKKAVEIEPIYCGTVAMQPTSTAPLHPGAAIFKQNCYACHRLDQKIIGPSLRSVYSRVPDEKWLRDWITNSSKMISEGDPYAVAIFAEYKNMQMTAFTGMKKEEMDLLIDYLRTVEKEEVVAP